jgi:hypothetical protein
MAEPMTDEEILVELKQFQDVGAIEFVLPTEPLGEEWVLGIRNNQGEVDLAKMNHDEVFGFIIGVSALANLLARKNRGVLPGL